MDGEVVRAAKAGTTRGSGRGKEKTPFGGPIELFR
jgi:hypothetical protein